MKNRIELTNLFREKYKTGKGVEVGTERGNYAVEIVKQYKGQLICVDFWQEKDIFEEAERKLLFRGVKMIKKTSLEAVNDFEDGSLDFVYIDADHHYEHAKQDIEIWFKKVRRGGVVSGHDYCQHLDFGVIQAVDEFCKQKGYKLSLTESDYWEGKNFPSWYFIKK